MAPAPEPLVSPPLTLVEQLERYKRSAALQIQAKNPAWVTAAAPEPLLRAVIVMRIRVDSRGRTRPEILRSPNRELGQRTLRSIEVASPLPAPPPDLATDLNRYGYTETWLYNRDGRFQIRTVALPQRSE
ncbi:hypothetical protein BH10PSE17_BH10PSE17_30160 [soil metagenome]